jgi:3-dehydroquinate dehydratase II
VKKFIAIRGSNLFTILLYKYSVMKIQIINGPNLNLLGKREPTVYGNSSFEDFLITLKARFPDIELQYYQSNVEGEIINKIHEVGFSFDGIILNAGAYTHTSVAIHDAIGAIKTPTVEVHISNVYAREEFRHKSLITSKCVGLLTGFGMESYALALQYFKNKEK